MRQTSILMWSNLEMVSKQITVLRLDGEEVAARDA